jgi:hypothetical protein
MIVSTTYLIILQEYNSFPYVECKKYISNYS